MAIVHLSTILDPTDRKKALARIGYFDDTTKRGRQVDYRRLLSWFVELPRKNLAMMGATGKLDELVQEVRALQEEGSSSTDAASTAAHLPKTQATVAAYLTQLTTTGRIEFEAFTLSPSIFIPRFRGLSNFPYSLVSSEPIEPYNGKGLLYLFYLTLKGAGDRLRKCPHCPALFVQARRKQEYCSTRCRVRALRARSPKKREQRTTKRQRHAHATKKGGKSHAKKSR